MRTEKILVVDDDPIICEICKANLQTEGYDVSTAENGQEAMKFVKQSPPDLVVLDRMMPKLSGEKVLDQLRKHELTKNLPVIFLTAKGSMQDVIEGLRLGANDYLIKPFSVNDLIKRVNATIERFALINGDESDWYKRSDSVSSQTEVSFKNPSDMPGILYALTRDIRSPNIKGIKLGLFECMSNAVYHGNLELDSEMKNGDNGFREYEELAIERGTEEKYKERQVRIRAEQNRGQIVFEITDNGNGFDWQNLPDPSDEEALLSSAGRGIILARFYFDTLEWNEAGNVITLRCDLSARTEAQTNSVH